MSEEVYMEDVDSEVSTEQLSALESFAANPGSKLATSTILPPSTQEYEDVPEKPVRARGRPRKNPVQASKVTTTTTTSAKLPIQSADVYELMENGRDVAKVEIDKWEKEKEETIEKLSAKAVRELDAQIKQSKKAQADSMRSGIEGGYAATMDDEEMQFKNGLLQKINMYYKFYEELEATNERRGKWSLKTSVKDLQDEIARCERSLAMDRAFSTMKHMDFFLNFIVETLAIKAFSVPCHGLAAESKKSQALVEEELKELSIKYHEWLDMGPETRYFFKFAQRVGVVLERNRNMMVRGQAPMNSTQEEKGLHNKYDDL